MGAHIDLVTKDRALSWGDGGFEEFIQAFSRKRTMSDASDWEGRLGNLQTFPAPVPSYSFEESSTVPNREPMLMPGTSMQTSTLSATSATDTSSQHHFQLNSTNNFQIPHQFQLLLQSGSFVPHGAVGAAAMMLPMQEPQEVRIGAYTKAERQLRIAKYRVKREKRIYKKQIKYDCRKKLADTRPRIKGRFVTKVDGDDEGAEGDSGVKEELRESVSIDSSDAVDAVPPVTENVPIDSPREVTSIHAETSCESFLSNKPNPNPSNDEIRALTPAESTTTMAMEATL